MYFSVLALPEILCSREARQTSTLPVSDWTTRRQVNKCLARSHTYDLHFGTAGSAFNVHL